MQKINKNFLEQIFSLKNKGKYKVIKILGFSIKIKRTIIFKKYYNLPIQENKIVFNNFQGNGYGCNPKYIAEEIIKRKLPYELVWLAKSNANLDDMPKKVKVVKFSSKKALKEIITSQYIISNVRLNNLIERGWEKREGQVYIQCWHGSLGIKKIDADVTGEGFVQREWCQVAQQESKLIDILLSNSDFENNVFKHGFWYDGEIYQVGHPRNDIFFWHQDKLSEIKSNVYTNLNIDTNTKTFLYVPSFRDDYRLDCYALDVEALKATLETKFGGNWAILVRMHPRLAKVSQEIFNYNDHIIDATNYSDIQELLVSADMAMTDYSSCIFDFMLSRKPAFIFATDIEKFNTERGFYYPLESTPFPVAKNNDELIKNIQNFNNEKYIKEVEKFLEDKGCVEDGQASKRVVELIKENMVNE